MKRFFSNATKPNTKKKSSKKGDATTNETFAAEASTTPTSVLAEQHLGGGFTREELRGALVRLGSTEDEAAAILAEVELHVDTPGLLEGEEEEEMRVAFGAYDTDGDGKISAEEIHEALRLLGDGEFSVEDCRRIIAGVDSDGDGMLCFRDFRRMMTTTTPPRRC